MTMTVPIRLYSQQLANPALDNPKEVVKWMGAMQAQNYSMVKWAIGIRMKSGNINTVNEALNKGEILRTHVMRPTWHLVAAEDIRWMLKLSAQRIKSANESFGRNLEITEELYIRCNRLIEKILTGNKNLTKQELGEELTKAGIIINIPRLTRFLARAETDGIICSGIDKGNKATYALLEERVPPVKEIHKEEALRLLAQRYFRSHSPASLQDFVWWSGLPVTEARKAIDFIESELVKERFASYEWLIHSSCSNQPAHGDIIHFLPSYDEYIISYKDRTSILDIENYPKAFTRYGVFFPVILHNGRISGNWNKNIRKGKISLEISFFEPDSSIKPELLQTARDKYKTFYSI